MSPAAALLVPDAGGQRGAAYGWKLVLCLTYIAVTIGLIRLNKHVMQQDKFPHALPLSAFSMFVSSAFCGVFYLLVPSMFSSMEATKGKRMDLMRWFVPMALLFAVNLFASNQAYLYCSVPFLQFMKETNPMIVFILSCIAGLQSCSRVHVFAILWVVLSTSVSISGEIHFALIGFIFQGASQLASCVKSVMGELLLSGKKFDALTYILFLNPPCFVVLGVATVCTWDHGIVSDFARVWHLLLAIALVGFISNVLGACVIKECSALGYVLVGITQDMFLVVISSLAFGERVTHRQTVAFVLTLSGIFFWSLLKTSPEALPVRVVETILCARRDGDETAPLLPKPVFEEMSVDRKV